MLDQRVGLLLANTAILVAGSVAISLPTGTFLAAVVQRTDVPLRRLFQTVLVALLFLPLYVQAAAWQAGFGLQGWYTLTLTGPGSEPWLAGWRAVIWIHGLASVPWVWLIVSIGCWLVEPELEEDSLLLAEPHRVLWHVTLRRSLPFVAVAALWTAVTVAGEMTVTDLFAVRTYAEELYTGYALGHPEAIGLGTIPLAIVTATAVLIAVTLLLRFTTDYSGVPLRKHVQLPLGRLKIPALLLVLVIVALLAGVPLLNLGYMAGIEVTKTPDGGLVRAWSAAKLISIIVETPIRYRNILIWSAIISSVSATAAVAIAVAVGWGARRGRVAIGGMLCLLAFCLAVAGPTFALGFIRFFNSQDLALLEFLYSNSILAPCAGQVVRALPLTMLIAWTGFRTVPVETLELATVDGSGPLRRLLQVVLPQRWGVLGIAWLTALAVSLGELATTVLLTPPGVQTVSTKVFELIHYGVDDYLAGLCLTLIAGAVATAALLPILLHRAAEELE